jgi:hypothetical protein
MKMLTVVLLLLGSSLGQDLVIHITAVQDHIRSKDEPSFSTPLHTKRVTGTIGNKRYELEEAALMSYRFEVGKDYTVVKVTDKSVKIRVTDRKGHESTESLVVRAVEEVDK